MLDIRIFDTPEVAKADPVLLRLRDGGDAIYLEVVDRDGCQDNTLLSISKENGKFYRFTDVRERYGFSLSSKGRIMETTGHDR